LGDLSADSLLAPLRFAPAIGSRPFLMVMGRHDEMCNPAEAEHVFHAINGLNAKLSFYDGTHQNRPGVCVRSDRVAKEEFVRRGLIGSHDRD
jgi:predicted esterase